MGSLGRLTHIKTWSSKQETQNMGATNLEVENTDVSLCSQLEQNVKPVETTRVLKKATHESAFCDNNQTLTERLSRFVELGTYAWTTTTPVPPYQLNGSQQTQYRTVATDSSGKPAGDHYNVAKIDLPVDLFSKSKFLRETLRNVAYFTADVVLNVKVQSTPYQAGILWMYQYPFYECTNAYRIQSTRHMRAVTAFPGVALNLASAEKEFQITVPYTNMNQFVKTESAFTKDDDYGVFGSFATVFITPITELSAPDNGSKVELVVSAQLTNIKTHGRAPFKDDMTTMEVQSGEVDEPSTMSKVASAIKWVSEVASAVASGFSRPVTNKAISEIQVMPGKGYTHMVGKDNSGMLALTQNNAIDPMATAPVSEDEMSIDFIAKRKVADATVNWRAADEHKKILFTREVHPIPSFYGLPRSTGSEYEIISRAINSTFYGSPVSYLTSKFKYWRGNLVLKFDFAKTQFHSGRLLVQYYPYSFGTSGAKVPDVVQPWEQVYSQVIDLANVEPGGVEVSFTSIMRNKWNRVNYVEQGFSHTTAAVDHHAGYIVVSVLSPLICPDTVKDRVEIIIWSHWMDYKVAAPVGEGQPDPCTVRKPQHGNQTCPGIPVKDAPATLAIRDEEEQVPPRSLTLGLWPENDEGISDCEMEVDSPGHIECDCGRDCLHNSFPQAGTTSSADSCNISPAEDCSQRFTTIGEEVTNLRALSRRFTVTRLYDVHFDSNRKNDLKFHSTSVSVASPYPRSIPWKQNFKNVDNHNKRGLRAAAGGYCDLYSFISYMYSAWHGSVRFKALVANENNGDTPEGNVFAWLAPGQVEARTDIYTYSGASPSTYLHTKFNNFLEIGVPYYTSVEQIPTGMDDFMYQQFTEPTVPIPEMPLVHLAMESHGMTNDELFQPLNCTLMVAAGDDHTFNYLVGCPPFVMGRTVFQLNDS